jgi:two-component system sensor kinase FixL
MSARRLNMETGEVLLSENFRNMLDDDVADDMPTGEYISRVHPDDMAQLLSCFEEGQMNDQDGDHRYIAADGSVRHIAALIQFDDAADGQPRSPRLASTILRNVSQKRAAEVEAEQTRLQLLKHSRLSAMGVMASTLAHELNQPLTVATNYLAMIENGFETRPDQVKLYAHRAAEKVLEAGKTIRSVRDYAADGAVSRRPENLHRLAATALSSVFGIPGQAHSTIVLNDVADDLTVQVDARMIEHAISNIVRNAVDVLADRPEGRIQITAHRAGEMIDLHIADNGPGIDDDIAVNLFSPFITTKEKGTGLGLPLCRTMVEANGGKINLIRHDARGALFSITLPCADTAQPIQQGKAL